MQVFSLIQTLIDHTLPICFAGKQEYQRFEVWIAIWSKIILKEMRNHSSVCVCVGGGGGGGRGGGGQKGGEGGGGGGEEVTQKGGGGGAGEGCR